MPRQKASLVTISMRKQGILDRHHASEARMVSGGPGPMEETCRILNQADPTHEKTLAMQRENLLREKNSDL